MGTTILTTSALLFFCNILQNYTLEVDFSCKGQLYRLVLFNRIINIGTKVHIQKSTQDHTKSADETAKLGND